jgi:acetyl-CoA acetyltransferase family protein
MEMFDTTIGWRFTNPILKEMFGVDSMPETAENVAKKYRISREAQDQFAYRSQKKTAIAMANHYFSDEIIPVVYKDCKGNTITVDQDEHPRPDTTLEKLAKLKPIFPNGTVTAGNASGVNDGASALLLMSAEKAKQLRIKPLAKYVISAVSGVEPSCMGIGPIESTKKALQRAKLTANDLDLVELNEAFASQSLACIQEIGLDPSRVNVNGGAIALGHPLGASGARILTTLIYEMNRRDAKFGLATMCVGVGQGISTIISR